MKNCPNCGAPLEAERNKCPYCGTLYYNFCDIDFNNPEPIYFQFRIGNAEIIQKAIPTLESITTYSETIDVIGGRSSSKLTTIHKAPQIETRISFTAVAMDEELYRMKEIK